MALNDRLKLRSMVTAEKEDLVFVASEEAAFLRDEAGVGPDEVVAVCPVDHYVDDSFYEAVLGLEQTVKTGRAELTLMGIEPTAPS